MTILESARNMLIAAFALCAALAAPATHAADNKYFAAASACAPFTSSTPDFAKLRFRPEGIINDSDSSKFVICNVPRDSEKAWVEQNSAVMIVAFRRTTTGTPAVTNNQCTVTTGFNATEPLQSRTFAARQGTQTYGIVTIDDIAPSDENSYAVMVCRIVPGSLLDLIILSEGGATDS